MFYPFVGVAVAVAVNFKLVLLQELGQSLLGDSVSVLGTGT